jgi:hypothetical protein
MKDEKPAAKQEGQQEKIQGRSIFIVETTAAGIAVQTGFLAEDGRVIQMPALFPTQDYALSQIDELRKAVLLHFVQAAQVGAQVIAEANQSSNVNASPDGLGPTPEDTIQ